MSSRVLTAAVIGTAVALVGGGLLLAFGDGSGSERSADSVARATRPEVTVATTNVADSLPPTETDPSVPPDPAVTVAPTTVEGGDGLLPIPNVLGTNRAVAETRLEAFEVTIEVVVATNVNDFDEITAQSPAGGERLAAGGTVELVFSERPRPETVDADPFPSGAIDSVEFDDVAAGECAVFRLDEQLLVFDPIDCGSAHDAQLLARVALENAPDDYDEPTIDALLRNQCEPVFSDFVGVSPSDSEAFRLFTIRPNPERYVSEGERESLCVILSRDGVRTLGSAEGTLW